MITLTEKAENKIIEISQKDNIAPIIRVGIKSFGCNGFGFDLFFIEENEINETDIIVEKQKIKIIVDNKSKMYVNNTKIDFINDLMNVGFKFENKDYTNICGCGKSFEIIK